MRSNLPSTYGGDCGVTHRSDGMTIVVRVCGREVYRRNSDATYVIVTQKSAGHNTQRASE